MQRIEHRKIRGIRLTRYVSIAGVVDCYAPRNVGTAPAEESRIDKRRTAGVQLRNECVCSATGFGLQWRAGRKIECNGLACDVSVA